MRIEGAVREGRNEAAFDAIRATVKCEQRRTATEREAFEAFADGVDDIEPVTPTSTAPQAQPGLADRGATLGVTTAGHSPRTRSDAIEAVREAYVETVMALPFHERLYGETYLESLQEEFGPDLATALSSARTFTPAVKQTLREEVASAIETRETLLNRCEREAAAVEAAADALVPLATEVRRHDDMRHEGRRFGALDAVWTRFGAIQELCDGIAADRQDVLSAHRRAVGDSDDPDAFVSYLYNDLDVTYPICALCSDLRAYTDAVRDRVETAIAIAN